MPQTPPPSSGESTTSDSPSTSPKAAREPPPRERKGGLACAECRRSKLKCDRAVPCQACVRRGCAALCPNGVMNATKGNKALQAHAQKLEEQVIDMSTRIRELESALEAAHLQLRAENPRTDYSQKDPSNARRRPCGQGSGSLAIDQDGAARYYGDTASSEYFTGLIPGTGLSSIHHLPDLVQLNLPPEIIDLFNAFPFGLRDRPYNKSIFLPFIPPRERAIQLAETYWQEFAWMINPVARRDFRTDIYDRIYGYSEVPTLDYIHPHKLAVFFGVLSLGVRRVDAADTIQSERYHTLSCAALSLAPIISEAMCATIQALYIANAFLYTTVRVASEECWILVGLCGRLSYRIGLHRDGSHFNLPRDETHRRRVLFWELFTWDAWLSFVTGRAPTIHLSNCDTNFPDDEHDSGIVGHHGWVFRYSAACLWPTVQVQLAETISYQTILDLDHRIRTFPVPIASQPPSPEQYPMRMWPDDPASALQQFCLMCEREMNLIFLHRNYFVKAIEGSPQNPLAHEYGGSVVAAYRSALRVCMTLRDLYRVHPTPVGKTWYFWSSVFSCCIILSAIIIKSSRCDIAKTALDELRAACNLFDEGSRPCRHPRAMYILQDLLRRAEEAFAVCWDTSGIRLMVNAQRPGSAKPDELYILGGLESVIQHPPRSMSGSPLNIATQVSELRLQSMQTNNANSTGSRRVRENYTDPQAGMGQPQSIANFDFFGSSNGFSTAQIQKENTLPLAQVYDQNMITTGSSAIYGTSPSDIQVFSPGLMAYSGSNTPNYFEPHLQSGGRSETFMSEGGHDNVWQSFIDGLMNPPGNLQRLY